VCVVVAGGFGTWWLVGTRKPEPPLIAARVAVVAAPKVKTAEEAKPVEDDLTKSLRMLEQAEVERRALEQSLAQREQEERAAASARRMLEEKDRDAKRHEAVKRDLAALGLASARRNVNITMYSTSWCGVCKQARAYMQQQQISFTELDVEHDPTARARQRVLNPRGSVPVIAVDDEVLIGFSASSLENRIDRAARHRTGS
jgi:glutaredoxin